MTDIVQRLRSCTQDKDNFPRMKTERVGNVALVTEAADIIEALTAERDKLREALSLARSQIERARAGSFTQQNISAAIGTIGAALQEQDDG